MSDIDEAVMFKTQLAARCRCTHEEGDTDCAVHPRCNNCGESIGGAEIKADRDRLLAIVFGLDRTIEMQGRRIYELTTRAAKMEAAVEAIKAALDYDLRTPSNVDHARRANMHAWKIAQGLATTLAAGDDCELSA